MIRLAGGVRCDWVGSAATEENWDRVLAVNLKGPYFLCQRVARAMLQRLPDLFHPTIVNISSLSSYTVSTSTGLLVPLEIFTVRPKPS